MVVRTESCLMPNSHFETLKPQWGFPGKESTCNAWDMSLIPRLGRSPEGGLNLEILKK